MSYLKIVKNAASPDALTTTKKRNTNVAQDYFLLYFLVHKTFKTLESYHSDIYFIFYCDNREVNSRNMTFTLQSNLPGMCPCMYLIGQHIQPPDIAFVAVMEEIPNIQIPTNLIGLVAHD